MKKLVLLEKLSKMVFSNPLNNLAEGEGVFSQPEIQVAHPENVVVVQNPRRVPENVFSTFH